MADEIKDLPEGTPAPEPKQLTEVEQRAVSQGWVPQDEWSGDPDQWRPAKEFLDRGELFKKIDEQNRTIKEFKRTLDDLAKHHSKVQKVEYERAYNDLKAAKKEALNEGNADAVIDIDEKMAMVREAQRDVPQVMVPEPSPDLNPVFVNWVSRNGWYETNKAMRAYADRIGGEYGAQGMSPVDILSAVEKEVKREFAEKFQNPNRNKPGAVETSTNKGGKAKDTFELSDDERRVMQRFVKTIPGYTEEKYIAELKKVKGV